MASLPRRIVGSSSHLKSESSVGINKRQKIVNQGLNIAGCTNSSAKSRANETLAGFNRSSICIS